MQGFRGLDLIHDAAERGAGRGPTHENLAFANAPDHVQVQHGHRIFSR